MLTATTPETLHSLITQMQEIEEQIIEAGGELTPEIEALISGTEEKIEDKLDSYAAMIDYLKGQAEYLEKQEKLFAGRKRTVRNSIDSMKDRMLGAMQVIGKDKIKTQSHSYSYRDYVSYGVNESATDGERRALVEFGLGTFEFRANKTAIKEKYKDTEEIPDYITVNTKTSLTIR
ncbi:siphovirus Gp157 family protein [Prosthecochloris sp. SCSIO W1102]|uniref:siphovirus Gp157 family protein n=1 Tax=Prosthecochloris sp. SCSIO W1102 TaxID=2992243 RepID=UPI00223E1C62|nr:siphovirus Gp157 family protein [Prosthecochloris sp. SCSIO W1102]UZJ39981.1 siphovirus Gp157 family protein [Prosthecochloris sp. SCSIO W1102]